MERRLQISAFRNIGFCDEKPSKEGLVLNHSLEKGKMGDLVILIGANNSGKSNVLGALSAYKSKNITERDLTDLFMEEECRNPSIKLICNDEQEQSGNRLFKDGNSLVNYPGFDGVQKEYSPAKVKFDKPDISALLSEVNRVINTENNYIERQYRKIWLLVDKYKLSIDSSEETINSFLIDYVKACAEYFTEKSNAYRSFIGTININCPILCAVKNDYSEFKESERKKNSLEVLNEKYKNKYGYDFEPTIFEYKQEPIKNGDLVTTYSDLSNSSFILAVLKAINVDYKTLINAHEDYVRLKNMGVLKTQERKLNSALKNITKRFNKMYYLDDSKYTFEFVLESEKIFFTLYRGEQSISLEYQSTGFRWFFDLYFNLFSSSKIKPGDIIIMDEPATNLHVKGQIELRSFLKEFAMKNDATIVLATHSPFLIDLDFLDELRIVSNKNNISSIENDFSAINIDDPDSLLPVKESLTVENHVLIDPDQNVAFVEGITDYNYFVGMKKVLGIDNVSFLPIKGVGKKGMQKDISQRLIKIRKHNPFLLADADAAGKAMKEVNKESELNVMILSEADQSFKEVEDLFSKEDASKFGIIDADGKTVKHNSVSAIFKNMVIANPSCVSEETKENFKRVFDLIID